MRIGAILPQMEIGSEPVLLRDYVQAVEGLGYTHLVVHDHVVGVHPDRPGGWSTAPPHGPYTYEHPFHEPLTLLSWMAAHTQRLELVSAVLILPQRQTVLVGKQAAEVDVLSGGRLRLGVGLGWNEVEYEALGEDFRTRGRRMEAQVSLLRLLWSQPVVDVRDDWHSVPLAGINPLPNRMIPVWMGGMHDNALRRAARVADGWFPLMDPDDRARTVISRLKGYLADAGRASDSFGIEGRVSIGRRDLVSEVERARRWRDLGAEYLSTNSMGANLEAREHLTALRRYRDACRAAGLGHWPER